MHTDLTTLSIFLLGALTLGAALAATVLPNPIHCGLSVALAFVGFGGLFIALGAEFVGFIQILVSVGAVAILIMFVILLTRPRPELSGGQPLLLRLGKALPGVAIALFVFAALAGGLLGSPSLMVEMTSPSPSAPVGEIGLALVGSHVLPLQLVGVLLTVALLGAVLFAFDNDPQ